MITRNTSFFLLTWFQGVQWEPSLDFSEDLGVAPVTGDLYVIKVKDLAGQLSEVKMAVLHETSKNLVTHKMLFYEPESLIDRS